MRTPQSRAGLHAVQISPTALGPLKPVALEATEISSGGRDRTSIDRCGHRTVLRECFSPSRGRLRYCVVSDVY